MVRQFITEGGHCDAVTLTTTKGVSQVAIGLEEKKVIVAEVNETAASALSLVIADARGVASNDMTACLLYTSPSPRDS